jgi:acyl-coenzyme A synthetase/AMP-(fatty) acid ligase
MINYFINKFEENLKLDAIIWNDTIITYSNLILRYQSALNYLKTNNVLSGEVIALNGDFTPNTIAMLLALIENKNIIVPLTSPLKDSDLLKYQIADVSKEIVVDLNDDTYHLENYNFKSNSNPLYQKLLDLKAAGLVLFTSGTSGKPKAAVHNFEKLLNKFIVQRNSMRTINFLLFDHWGGLNTLFHTLSNLGVVISLRNRKPESVCEIIQKHKIELLPVSPSFLNLLILSELHLNYDLSSLKVITYGTEPMPQTTLHKAKQIFNFVKFNQTYGLIELGVLRSKSKSDDSLWVKLGGEGYDLRVIDGILQIKAESAMLGYLNALSPFTDDGYFITGDQVEVEGEYYKILGRKSEIINVGGEKVYPQEIENILLSLENILEVTVYGEKNALMGNIVCAKIVTKYNVDKKEFSRKIKSFCKDKLQSFKIPVKIEIDTGLLYNERFKKIRNNK